MTSPTAAARRRLSGRRALLGLGVAGALLVGASAAVVATAPAADAAPVTASVTASALTTSALTSTVRAGAVADVAASVPADVTTPAAPTGPSAPTGASSSGLAVSINGVDGKPSSAIVLILAITLLSVAPALLLMTTAFTKIFVVLGITRNALGLQSVPPNQVLAGLALFLSLFVMAPVFSEINHTAVQPYLHGTLTQSSAFEIGVKPLRAFMLHQTRDQDLALITRAAHRHNPHDASAVPLTTLIPAFVLSELRAAMIIGFVVYVPFVVIDIVVSSALMALGMAMLPPVTVSLPFKLLMFVMVNGWGLIITALVGSYHT